MKIFLVFLNLICLVGCSESPSISNEDDRLQIKLIGIDPNQNEGSHFRFVLQERQQSEAFSDSEWMVEKTFEFDAPYDSISNFSIAEDVILVSGSWGGLLLSSDGHVEPLSGQDGSIALFVSKGKSLYKNVRGEYLLESAFADKPLVARRDGKLIFLENDPSLFVKTKLGWSSLPKKLYDRVLEIGGEEVFDEIEVFDCNDEGLLFVDWGNDFSDFSSLISISEAGEEPDFIYSSSSFGGYYLSSGDVIALILNEANQFDLVAFEKINSYNEQTIAHSDPSDVVYVSLLVAPGRKHFYVNFIQGQESGCFIYNSNFEIVATLKYFVSLKEEQFKFPVVTRPRREI